MRALAICASPRKDFNTAELLTNALNGAKSNNAEIEMINLYDFTYKGCISCFACKQKHSAGNGVRALKDDLTAILEKAMSSDVLFLGSPIYFNGVTGMMRTFIERLLFMNLTYDDPYRKAPEKSISTACFFTMNLPKEAQDYYIPLFEATSTAFSLLGGTNEYMASYDTFQFEDYSKYAAGVFDVRHKEQVKKEQFPIDCKRAFEIGASLIK